MRYIREELLREIERTSLPATELSMQQSAQIHRAAWERFATTEDWHLRRSFFWEELGPHTSVRGVFAWELIDKVLREQPGDQIFMFFDERDETPAFVLPRGTPIVPLLAQTFHFEFYLTNEATDYLLCFNHHDFLIAAGTAIGAVESLKEQTDLPVNQSSL